MPELTQPFLLAAAHIPQDQSLDSWLKSLHIQPRWLDEIIVLSADAHLRFTDLPGADAAVLLYPWPNWQRSELFAVQQSFREIATGERRLILLISEAERTSSVLLLAAPAVIGYYNQVPQAYLNHLFVQHLSATENDLLALLENQLTSAGRKPEELHTLSLQAKTQKRPGKSGSRFASATWAKSATPESGALAALVDVIHSLNQTHKKNGLVADLDSEGNLYGVWVERV